MNSKKILFSSLFLSALFSTEALAIVENDVPFTSQAPLGLWEEPWANACEEASITMVAKYYENQKTHRVQAIITTDEAQGDILNALQYKNVSYGVRKDEDALMVASLINRFYPFEATTFLNPTLESMLIELRGGRPVIIPVSGKELKNPYFINGGPNYHMLVLSGYDEEKEEFITQEPGTRYGLDFRYSYATILDAIHDFSSGDMSKSVKKAIFTNPLGENTNKYDWDEDGLTKEEEFTYHTNPSLSDTDFDGYPDGIEIQYGYSPIIPADTLTNGMLIKKANVSTVYLFRKNEKIPISNAEAFLRNGWKWDDIVILNDEYMDSITTSNQRIL
ncbi:MAG: C39 family peptidase [Candidatus Magasanikbacteria bacterium]